MKHTFEIDVPSVLALVSDPCNADLFYSCCNAVGIVKDAVLAMPEKVHLALMGGYIYSRFDLFRLFSDISVDVYDNDAVIRNCTTVPNVVANIDDEAVRDIEYEMICHIHQLTPKGNSVFVVRDSRWQYPKGTLLHTLKDKKNIEHRTIVLSSKYAFDLFIKENTPKLVQLKHGAKTYTINGRTVSAFSTLYLFGEKEANRLLLTAYHDAETDVDTVFPERLYTWDAHSQTYIEFRRSLNNEYHGFELPENEWRINVPKNIRAKFHHGL